MLIRLLSAALAAGFLAAVLVTGLELALTSPLIIAAERYESPGRARRRRLRRSVPIACRSCWPMRRTITPGKVPATADARMAAGGRASAHAVHRSRDPRRRDRLRAVAGRGDAGDRPRALARTRARLRGGGLPRRGARAGARPAAGTARKRGGPPRRAAGLVGDDGVGHRRWAYISSRSAGCRSRSSAGSSSSSRRISPARRTWRRRPPPCRPASPPSSPRARSPSPSCSGRRSGSVSGVPGRPSARRPRVAAHG